MFEFDDKADKSKDAERMARVFDMFGPMLLPALLIGMIGGKKRFPGVTDSVKRDQARKSATLDGLNMTIIEARRPDADVLAAEDALWVKLGIGRQPGL